MKHILATTLVGLMTLGGLLCAGVAFGETEHGPRHHERHMERGEHYGPGGRDHQHHPEHHGSGGTHGDHHGAHHGREGHQRHHAGHGPPKDTESFARHWERMLTPEQRTKVDQLRVNHAKVSAPLRAKMGSLKIDLAVLATAEKPDTTAIRQHIDQLLELKNKVMQQRYAHIAAVREVLTPEQRAPYDMMILRHAKRRKRGGQW